jgi:hypothetical protein
MKMATRTTSDVTLEMEAVLRLASIVPVSREQLEEATMEVERALDEHTLDLADGASASTNFQTDSIEIDVRLVGASVSELHQKVALIVTQLDRYCSLDIAVPAGALSRAPMTVRSSETQLVGA